MVSIEFAHEEHGDNALHPINYERIMRVVYATTCITLHPHTLSRVNHFQHYSARI